MDKTPIHSNLSRRGARNNKATELPTSATDRVVLDFAVSSVASPTVRGLAACFDVGRLTHHSNLLY